MVATPAQASPATSAYCTPGFSTNAAAVRAITVTYIDPIKNEQTAANTSNPSSGSSPMRLFFTRWAKFLPLAGGNNIVVTITETITISDTGGLGRIASKIRAAAAQTITISDTGGLARIAAKTRSPTAQTITISDTGGLVRVLSKIRTATETISVSGTLSNPLRNKIRALTETITLTGVASRVASKKRSAPAAETITISDSLAILRKKIRSLTETIALTGTASRIGTRIKSLPAETITLSSTVVKQAAKVRDWWKR